MTIPDGARGYYRMLAPVLLAHLAGRALYGLPTGEGDPADATRIAPAPATADELVALAEHGTWQLLAPAADRIALHLIPGEGSDIATAASAALQLAEQCTADGLAPVPLTDGRDGLWLMARAGGDVTATAARYATVLADRAPELATADPAQADGRSLLRTHPGPDGELIPLPYTLLSGPSGAQPVIPLHPDEIAAIAAGMPAEFGPQDVAGRVTERGDLAAALLGAPAG